MRRKKRSSISKLNKSNQDESYYVDVDSKDQITYWSLSILLELNGHSEKFS